MPLEACPSCASTSLTTIYSLPAIPVQSCILVDTREEATGFRRHGLELRFCDDCGFIFNALFDERLVDYASLTEESQHFSGTFDAFAKQLVSEIKARYDLQGRNVLEVGCGKGDFLQELCAQTGCDGVGVDPGFIPERLMHANRAKATFQREYFDPAKIQVAPDFVACRHTLEHIGPVGDFIAGIHSLVASRPGVGVFFETPDVRRILATGAFWDIYFEHCSYFTMGSHARLFRQAGFDVTEIRLDYADQYIIQYAHPRGPQSSKAPVQADDLDELRTLAAQFPEKVKEVADYWGEFVGARHAAGKRIAIWGGGSKGVSFLTSLGLGTEVAQVIDVNPFKQGKYLPGTGHCVLAPPGLRSDPPDTVVVMNPVYVPEIGACLREMGLTPELVTL
jgi:SAM-dependent methyltransferase